MLVSGTILDEFGDPLSGVHVYLASNEKIGDTTDFDGKFTINNPAIVLTSLLKLSYVGYKTALVTAAVFGAKKPIQMIVDSTVLTDTTVYGYKNSKFNPWWLLLLIPVGYFGYEYSKPTPKKITL